MKFFEYPYVIITILVMFFLIMGLVGLFFTMKSVKTAKGTAEKGFCGIGKIENDFEKMAIGHEGIFLDKSIIRDYYDLTKGLLEETIVGRYEECGFRKGEVARLGMAELWYQCDA